MWAFFMVYPIFAETKPMDSSTSKRYDQRGVSASKEDVHNAIKNIDKGLFPNAFCKIVSIFCNLNSIGFGNCFTHSSMNC